VNREEAIKNYLCPNWLKEAEWEGDVDIVKNGSAPLSSGCVTWNCGIWHDGTWYDGLWKNGRWKNGLWLKGIWENGTWHDGTWLNGEWKTGIWKGGVIMSWEFDSIVFRDDLFST